jgi:hypothetical protein
VSHRLVLGLFPSPERAAAAAHALRGQGIGPAAISVVARSHQEEGELARAMDATPGVEIEDSRTAARLGELSAIVLAAVALVLPGLGPVVAAGPLGAGLGEAAGHLAGGLASVLTRAGVRSATAVEWQAHVMAGKVLLGVHVRDAQVERVREALAIGSAEQIEIAQWEGDVP